MQHSFPQGTFRVDVFDDAQRWAEVQKSLIAEGRDLPLTHRTEWLAQNGSASTWFITVGDDRTIRAASAIKLYRSRIASQRILRLERYVPTGGEADKALVAGVAQLLRLERGILRAHLELFSPHSEHRSALASELGARGFIPATAPRSYDRTVVLDLSGDLDSIFAGLHKTARQNIRGANKRPVEVRPIADESEGNRLNELLAETLSRTGGAPDVRDWSTAIGLSNRHPELSRLVGLYRTDGVSPSLLSFAWGCCHGNHVQYSTAASTRLADLKVSMVYPLLWDLISWARDLECGYFDFGGISHGSHGGSDPLGGISDFKRYFSKEVVSVGDEWVLSGSGILPRLTSAVSSALRLVGRY